VTDHYVPCHSLVPIRARGVLHFYAGRDVASDRPRVLATGPRTPTAEARTRLAALARIHRLVANDRVPAVVDASLDGPEPWVVLDCDAISDLDHLSDYVRETGDKPPHAMAVANVVQLMQALIAIHRVRDPETGELVRLGSLARGNMLFSPSGRMWLVGCGAGPLADAFVAPEVACGGPATEGSDLYAVKMFMRSQMGLIAIAPMAQRIFVGKPLPGDAETARRVAEGWSVLTMPPEQRPTVAEALEHLLTTWRNFGFVPDAAGFEAWVARVLAAPPERLVDFPHGTNAPCIRLGADGEWLETPNGMRHSLRARRSLRRLLLALAEARRSWPGTRLSVEELVQAGWPGENPLVEAGANRVYVAISTLRQLGLNNLLQRFDGGYRLDPSMPCELASERAPTTEPRGPAA
jgi:hypothetical protein